MEKYDQHTNFATSACFQLLWRQSSDRKWYWT